MRLDYRYRFAPAWAAGARLSVAQTDRTATYYEVRERWLGATVFGAWHADLGAVRLGVLAGATLRYVHQRQRRRDAQRVAPAGYPVEETFSAVAGGGVAELTLQVPFATRFFRDLSAIGALTVVREAGGFEPRFEGGVDSGFGVRF